MAIMSIACSDFTCSFIGGDSQYRKADGSGNVWRSPNPCEKSLLIVRQNPRWPELGAAGSHYARSVRPKTVQPAVLPEPETLFDSLLARKDFEEHPNKISSVLFYIASIIIHGRFLKDGSISCATLT